MRNRQPTLRILIVEDEAIQALRLKMAIQKFGYQVSGIAASCIEAIRHVEQHYPDMVLLDINLHGGESGISAGQEIWQCHRIPIIYLTSYCDDKTLRQAMQSEPYGYLTKPFRDPELKATLKTAWHKHSYFQDRLENSRLCRVASKRQVSLAKGYRFDRISGALTREGEIIKLTGNEIKFLRILSEQPGSTILFAQINAFIWRESVSDPARLRNLVYRIRQKVDAAVLENVFEAGYRLILA